MIYKNETNTTWLDIFQSTPIKANNTINRTSFSESNSVRLVLFKIQLQSNPATNLSDELHNPINTISQQTQTIQIMEPPNVSGSYPQIGADQTILTVQLEAIHFTDQRKRKPKKKQKLIIVLEPVTKAHYSHLGMRNAQIDLH